MKILICTNSLSSGGAERVATLWAKGFIEQGHQVIVVLDTNSDTVSYPLSDNIPTYNIYKKECRISRELAIFRAQRLRKVLVAERPDCIIGVLASWCRIMWMARIGLNIPFIDTEHNAFERPVEAPMPLLERLDKFFFSRWADYMTILTEADNKIIAGRRKNVSVLPNPLTFQPATNVPAKENIILACGRLDAWKCKGFDLLIKAWGMTAEKHPDWKLVIAGDGEAKNILLLSDIAVSAKLTQTNFEMTGRCEDMKSLYARSAIFVLSSRWEGFGMVLTEAMSQGCACIACDYKGRQQEIIGGDNNGLIVPVNDVHALANAIDKMIVDEEFRNMVQRGGLQRSKAYSLHVIMKKWNNIFHALSLA